MPPGVGLSRAAGTLVELEVTGVHGDCQYPKVFTCCPDPVGLKDATGKDFTRVIQSVSQRKRFTTKSRIQGHLAHALYDKFDTAP